MGRPIIPLAREQETQSFDSETTKTQFEFFESAFTSPSPPPSLNPNGLPSLRPRPRLIRDLLPPECPPTTLLARRAPHPMLHADMEECGRVGDRNAKGGFVVGRVGVGVVWRTGDVSRAKEVNVKPIPPMTPRILQTINKRQKLQQPPASPHPRQLIRYRALGVCDPACCGPPRVERLGGFLRGDFH